MGTLTHCLKNETISVLTVALFINYDSFLLPTLFVKLFSCTLHAQYSVTIEPGNGEKRTWFCLNKKFRFSDILYIILIFIPIGRLDCLLLNFIVKIP